jgi:hypothetical protein
MVAVIWRFGCFRCVHRHYQLMLQCFRTMRMYVMTWPSSSTKEYSAGNHMHIDESEGLRGMQDGI